MSSLKQFFQRVTSSDSGPRAGGRESPHRDQQQQDADIATAWTADAQRDGESATVTESVPVPSASVSSRYFELQDHGGRRRPTSSSSSSSDDDDQDPAAGAPQSASYFRPRTLDGYSRYLEAVYKEGELEKQSSENPRLWKKRWFVMQENKLFYYKSQRDVIDNKPSDKTCCAVISLEDIDSVTTAKDFGVAAFQIRLESRRFILRAESRDRMHDWLFNFQKSIANIVSALSRQAEYRPSRLHNSLSRRRSMSRVNRSVSFDYQDYGDHQGNYSFEDYLRGRASIGFFSSESFSDESTGEHSRTSPRRASSPISIGSFGPRSPLMFAFDPMDEFAETQTTVLRNEPLVEESKEELEDGDNAAQASDSQRGDHGSENQEAETPPIQQTLSPPVATGKYIPRFLRNRSAATPTSPPPSEGPSPPSEPVPAPAPAAGRWVPRHQREGYADLQPVESFSFNTRESLNDSFIAEDNYSYSSGDDIHGVTSLIGVRSTMEDVCSCIPDLNAAIGTSESSPKQALYALFDGHSGVRAASFSNQRFVSYLCGHEAFHSNTQLAFEECFRRIDKEFLEKAEAENLSDGTTAAVVLIRGNRLMTANVGDSRAVVSIGGQALDIIEEQTPGREDERQRIESRGGWVREERELHMSKLHSMDLSDPEIQQKAERVVQWVNIYRVNGELAVSRAIGDIDYKGEWLSKYEYWAFPDGHDRAFHGDLVIADPEYQEIEITPEFEFLILACDGLWDTITSKEAVRHVAVKLKEGASAKQASHSLANLAIRSGSSDNVSVVIVLLNTEHSPLK